MVGVLVGIGKGLDWCLCRSWVGVLVEVWSLGTGLNECPSPTSRDWVGYLKVVREGVLLGVGVGVLGRVRKGMGLYVTGSLVGLLVGFGKRLSVC